MTDDPTNCYRQRLFPRHSPVPAVNILRLGCTSLTGRRAERDPGYIAVLDCSGLATCYYNSVLLLHHDELGGGVGAARHRRLLLAYCTRRRRGETAPHIERAGTPTNSRPTPSSLQPSGSRCVYVDAGAAGRALLGAATPVAVTGAAGNSARKHFKTQTET